VAITRDQKSSLTASSSTGSTSVTITFPTLPTAGSSVIAALGINFNGTGSVTSVKDNGTSQSTFTQDVTKTGTANHISYIYRADGISLPSSGSYTITVLLTVTGASVSLGAASYLGKAAGAPAATNTGTATSTSVSTGSVTPSLTSSLFVGTFQDNSSGTADNPTVTNGAFTQQLSEGNGSSGQVYGFADAIPANTTAEACTWTVGTSATYSAAIAVYSPSGTTASAGLATATGVALQVPSNAGLATATGTAFQVPAPAGLATATGTAFKPLFTIPAQLATATGSASQRPSPAGLATASGTAFQVPAPAGLAHGTGTAPGITPWKDTVLAGLAAGFAETFQPTPRILRTPLNLGAVLTEVTADGFMRVVTADATFTLADYGATLALANFGASLTGWTMQTAPLTLNEFNDVTISITVTQNGSPLNLTGDTLNLLLKTAPNTPDANALVFSSAGGSPAIVITNPAGGLATAIIPNTDLDAETYNFYRLDVVSGGLTNTTLYGSIVWISL
jgi:hypothetical protein